MSQATKSRLGKMEKSIVDVKISIAQTISEKSAAYRLRYDVFTTELGDERYANHETKEFKDEDDVDGSVIFIGKFGEDVVASCRLKPLQNREFIALDQYGLVALAQHLGREFTMLSQELAALDRAVVAKLWRGSGITEAVFADLERTAIQQQVRTLVVAIEKSKRVHAVFYQRVLGFRSYPVTGEHRGLDCQCMYKLIGEHP